MAVFCAICNTFICEHSYVDHITFWSLFGKQSKLYSLFNIISVILVRPLQEFLQLLLNVSNFPLLLWQPVGH